MMEVLNVICECHAAGENNFIVQEKGPLGTRLTRAHLLYHPLAVVMGHQTIPAYYMQGKNPFCFNSGNLPGTASEKQNDQCLY